MNDLITMSIQGGRYLEAEKQLGDIIISNPSAEAYFMLGTVKSNLLLDKGRSYLEVQFCFNKYLELTEDRSEGERNIMAFCVGLYSQLAELEQNLISQRKKESRNIVLGALVTFAASKVIDGSKKSFGAISGIVGASFGIGMSMDGLSNIGSISDMIAYVSRIKIEMVNYLQNTIENEKQLFQSEVMTLSEKHGSVGVVFTDDSKDVSLLQSLGANFIPPTQAIAMTKDKPKGFWNVNGFLTKKPFEIPSDDPVIGGITSLTQPEIMEFLFTSKGVYAYVNSKFYPYKEIKFKKNIFGFVSINGSATSSFRSNSSSRDDKDIIEILNDFVSKMSS